MYIYLQCFISIYLFFLLHFLELLYNLFARYHYTRIYVYWHGIDIDSIYKDRYEYRYEHRYRYYSSCIFLLFLFLLLYLIIFFFYFFYFRTRDDAPIYHFLLLFVV